MYIWLSEFHPNPKRHISNNYSRIAWQNTSKLSCQNPHGVLSEFNEGARNLHYIKPVHSDLSGIPPPQSIFLLFELNWPPVYCDLRPPKMVPNDKLYLSRVTINSVSHEIMTQFWSYQWNTILYEILVLIWPFKTVRMTHLQVNVSYTRFLFWCLHHFTWFLNRVILIMGHPCLERPPV